MVSVHHRFVGQVIEEDTWAYVPQWETRFRAQVEKEQSQGYEQSEIQFFYLNQLARKGQGTANEELAIDCALWSSEDDDD